MTQSTLPFDIQYLILQHLSSLGTDPVPKDAWEAVLNYLCICRKHLIPRQWHEILGGLLVQNTPAYILGWASMGIAQNAIERVVADYNERELMWRRMEEAEAKAEAEAEMEEDSRTGTNQGQQKPSDDNDANANNNRENLQADNPPTLSWTPTTYSARSTDFSSNEFEFQFEDPLTLDIQQCALLSSYRGSITCLEKSLSTITPIDINPGLLLTNAIETNQLPTLSYLLSTSSSSSSNSFPTLKFDINTPTEHTSPLGYAVYNRKIPATAFLLSHQGNPNRDIRLHAWVTNHQHSLSLVSYAAWCNDTALLEVLLAHGLDVEDPGVFARYGVDFALRVGEGVGEGLLYQAVRWGGADVVRVLLELEGKGVVEGEVEGQGVLAGVVEAYAGDDVREVLREYGVCLDCGDYDCDGDGDGGCGNEKA
ncbi:hypothetical protein BJY04DRAFT_217006 [Aspergillus karnatakaensis]|uniref:uncharacterized protein n=1 Tax=Aspergillus karnatakaensis TaxID=1810916 RepID=UPI003CCCF9BA